MKFLLALSLFGLVSCAALDKNVLVKQVKMKKHNGDEIMEVVIIADAAYPHNSKDAEKLRKEWIQGVVEMNGYSKYKIISRSPATRVKGLFGDIVDITYVIEPEEKNTKD